MTNSQLFARAVAYEASRAPRFYSDLTETERHTFWALVNNERNHLERRRLARMFRADQNAAPQVLP